jgi:hypothetical protein
MRESGPGYWLQDEVAGTLDANMGSSGHANRVATLAQPPSMTVRRLTPRECERLQGFPDDYTLIPHKKGLAADASRYKALGNSMAVPVMRWIGARIAQVDALDGLGTLAGSAAEPFAEPAAAEQGPVAEATPAAKAEPLHDRKWCHPNPVPSSQPEKPKRKWSRST